MFGVFKTALKEVTFWGKLHNRIKIRKVTKPHFTISTNIKKTRRKTLQTTYTGYTVTWYIVQRI